VYRGFLFRYFFLVLLFILTFFTFVVITPVYGATVFWVGGASGTWETDANWSTGVVPSTADDVTIDNSTVTLSGGQTANFTTLNIGSGSTTNLILIGNIGTGMDINIANNAILTAEEQPFMVSEKLII